MTTPNRIDLQVALETEEAVFKAMYEIMKKYDHYEGSVKDTLLGLTKAYVVAMACCPPNVRAFFQKAVAGAVEKHGETNDAARALRALMRKAAGPREDSDTTTDLFNSMLKDIGERFGGGPGHG